MKCIIIIAAPAAGKGTISDYIKDKYNYKHISTGNLLREGFKNNNEKIMSYKESYDKGLLASDDMIKELLDEEFEVTKTDFVLEGMPRNLNQGYILKELFNKYNIELDKVIFIDINKEIAIDRINNRLICEDCESIYNRKLITTDKCTKCGGNLISRSDDTEETYITRYDTFVKQTKPLLEYYGDKVVTIYNNTSLEDVYKSVDEVLKGDE